MIKRNENIIKQKIMQYIIPGVMLTAALQVGNIVDTIMVGNILGPVAMSAVKIGMAIDNVMELPGYVLAIGGSVAVGNLLGKREREKANRVFSCTLAISLILGLVFSILSLTSPWLAVMLTGGNELTGDVQRFIFMTLLCAPIVSMALQMISYVAVDNNPSLASAYVITANVLNLGIDYILLKYSPLGTAGAALSTALGYGIAMVLLIGYVKSSKRMLSLINPFRNMKESLMAAGKAGIPTLLFMVFLTLKDIGLNSMTIRVIGTDAMIIYTVCANVVLCVELLAGGIIGIISSIGSVLYGEKDYFGIRSLVKHVMIYSYGVLVVLMVILILKPEGIVILFGVSDPRILGVAVTALRIFILSLPFYLWNKFFTTYYQSTDKTTLSSISTSLQTCVAILPAAYILVFCAKAMKLDMLNAFMIAFIVSEVITTLAVLVYRKVKYKGEDFLILPEQNDKVTEFTISNQPEKIEEATKEVMQFAVSNQVPEKRANLMAVAVEEMLVNIFCYGGKNAKDVDVILHVTDEAMILRVTDNGIPFDPTDYTVDYDQYEIHGIETIKKLSTKVQYIRVLDLNNTILEVDYH